MTPAQELEKNSEGKFFFYIKFNFYQKTQFFLLKLVIKVKQINSDRSLCETWLYDPGL